MFWIKPFANSVITALALSSASAALAETIVVKSAGPSARSYPPGKSIPDNSKLTLKSGDSVTILDGRGTRIFKGPGLFATTASTATDSSFSALLRNTGTRQVRTGAVRGAGTTVQTRPASVWLVDASKSGTVCVAGTGSVSLWIPPHDAAANLTITRQSDGKSVPVAMRALQSVKAWPLADLPIKAGEQFKIAGHGFANPAVVRFAVLGPNPQGLESTASALIKAGCNAQLDLLIETVSAPADAELPVG